MMTPEFFSRLLYEPEGTTLDFKREPYRFYGATDKEKAQFLKDILAFTNACWRADGYILIGIDEAKQGHKAVVVGTLDHPDDADLQQFVNGKTNDPVEFSYARIELEGKVIGVYHIPIQQRPRYLNKAYGDLAANTVYIRRGSSTAVATPDEVIQMGVSYNAIPQLDLEFADRTNRRLLGAAFNVKSVLLDLGDISAIPDYPAVHPLLSMGLPASMFNLHQNSNYYRELAEYAIQKSISYPLQLAVFNRAGTMATDVRLELSVARNDEEFFFFDRRDALEPPRKQREFTGMGRMMSMSKDLVSPTLEVTRLADRWLIEAAIEKVQPKSIGWLWEDLYIGSLTEVTVTLDGSITADNIPTPQSVQLLVHCQTEYANPTLDQLEEAFGDGS